SSCSVAGLVLAKWSMRPGTLSTYYPIRCNASPRRAWPQLRSDHRPDLFCFAGGATHYDFWAAFVPAIYPATAPPTPPTTMDVRTTPHGQTGHDANNAAKRLICVLLPQTS